jgi:hypothetical protein
LAEIVVVADAGPLIAFGRLDKFSVPNASFDRVIVPQAVYEETQLHPATPDASASRPAVQGGTLTLDASARGAILRASLLPKPISGELRVEETEKFVERTV